MKTFVILSLLFVAALAVPPHDNINPFIVGGGNAIPGEFPFVVSITHFFLGGTHICGGVIISADWVLTSAECITESSTRGSIDVLAGKHNLAIAEAGEQRREIVRNRSHVHPGWTAGRYWGPYDIALARLSAPLTFGLRIRAIRIPPPNQTTPAGIATLAGWGSTNAAGTGQSNLLQRTTFPIITNAACRGALDNMNRDGTILDYTKFCTGPLTGGTAACSGDFGGALFQGTAGNEIVIGIASWGFTPCGTVGAPSGIYTSVTDFANWITANTGVHH